MSEQPNRQVAFKSGRRAQGSHQTLSPNDARTCCVCGERLVVSRQKLRFATSLGLGWHVDCDEEGWRMYREVRKGGAKTD